MRDARAGATGPPVRAYRDTLPHVEDESAVTRNDRTVDTAALHACAETVAADWLAARPEAPAAALRGARERSADLGVDSVSDSVGMTLSMFTRMLGARTVVEVGTGVGISGQWLLGGMREDGVLTTIDVEPEHQKAARAGFSAAGFAPARTRLIGGRALEVLPRLADDSYDLVFVDGGNADHACYVDEAVRLLRRGGLVVLHGMLGPVEPWDTARRDPAATDARETLRLVADHGELLPSVLPVSDGLVCAARI